MSPSFFVHIVFGKRYSRIWQVVFLGNERFATLHDDGSVQIWSLAGLKLE